LISPIARRIVGARGVFMKRPSLFAGLVVLLVAWSCGGQGSGATTSSSGGAGGRAAGATGGSGGQVGEGSGGGAVACDPFTGAPCAVARGETCDYDGVAFTCFDPPNGGALCGACGLTADGGFVDYCGVGLTCLDSGKCAAFCCADGDCGPGGACDKTYLGDPSVGVCAAASSGGADAGTDAGADAGGSDAGGDGTGGSGGGGGGGSIVTEPACSVPATLPSGGACYMP
jgi:hypothetical protein